MAKNNKAFTLAKEFKEFISRGNVLDMAVGVIIGGAFTAIVNSAASLRQFYSGDNQFSADRTVRIRGCEDR